jgi:MYXO-CTERM domain-containing protein
MATAHIDKTVNYTLYCKESEYPSMRGDGTLAVQAKAECAGHGKDNKTPAAQPATWAVKDGLATRTNGAIAGVPHAAASGGPALAQPAPTKVGGGGASAAQYAVKANHTLDASSQASACPGGNAKADPGHASVNSRIQRARVDGWDLRGKVNGVEIPRQTGKGAARAQVTAGRVSYGDPISVTVTDLDTSTVTTEDLFSLAIDAASGEAEVSFEYDLELGLTLSTGRNAGGIVDGNISIAGAADSTWLVSPFGQFGATLSGGAFTATGVWADKPWLLTFDGSEVVGAYLPAAFIPAVFDYTVPDSIIASDNSEYQQDYGVETELTVSAEVVPEPAALSMLVLGGLALLRRRR